MKHNFILYEQKIDDDEIENSKFDDDDEEKLLPPKLANEKLLKHNDRISQDRVSLQAGFLENWLKEDEKIIGPKFIGDFSNFSSKDFQEKIKINRFKANSIKEKYSFEVEHKVWRILHERDSNFKNGGLSLRNEIVKFDHNINLRSLGCKMILDFSIIGPGSLNIFSRTRDFSNEESVLLRVEKQGAFKKILSFLL